MRFLLPSTAAVLATACSFSGTPGSGEPMADAASGEDSSSVSPDAAVIPACIELPSGALAWWDGEELGVDRLQNFPMQMVFQDPTVEPGLVGNAMTLDENEDIIFSPAPGAAQFTVEGWIRRAKDDVDYMTIYGNGDEAGLFLLDHRLVYYDADGSGNGDVAVGTTTLSLGTYYHVAATYNGATVAVYIDGVEDGAVTTDVAINLPTIGRVGGVLFSVGDGDGNDFVGQIDELTIYDRALAPEEIAGIAAAGSLGKCKR